MNMQDSLDKRNVETIAPDNEEIQLNQDALESIAKSVNSNVNNPVTTLVVDSKDDTKKIMVSAAFLERFLVALVDLFSQEGDDWDDYLVNEAAWGNSQVDDKHPAYIIFESMQKASEFIELDLDDLPVIDEDDTCSIGNNYQYEIKIGDRVKTYAWAYSSSNYEKTEEMVGTVEGFFFGNYPVGVIVRFDDTEKAHEIQACFLEPENGEVEENEEDKEQ